MHAFDMLQISVKRVLFSFPSGVRPLSYVFSCYSLETVRGPTSISYMVIMCQPCHMCFTCIIVLSFMRETALFLPFDRGLRRVKNLP